MQPLALDLGTTMGYATRVDGRLVVGSANFALRRSDSPGVRFLRFRAFVAELVELAHADIIVYEEVSAHKGCQAAHLYGGFEATLQSWCVECGIEHAGVPVGAIKKFATGRGNASKDEMLDWAQSELSALGHGAISSHDAADALALLRLIETRGLY